MENTNRIFDTDKRIKLGIWGLGRGAGFIHSCAPLNIDVVAGCDYNPVMRERFQGFCKDAFVTDDEDEFLARDFDAVLVATYFENHARDCIKALKAGKHVMCEVTSFFTPAQGVELVEAVEASGKVYNLLENYPFTKNCMYVKRLWDEGFFGDLMYAEADYAHDCKQLCYPSSLGWTAHDWRSWLNFHYYNTHSLGPILNITGLRPVKVTALKSTMRLNGFTGSIADGGPGSIAPSLIQMNNGAIVRNLMASSVSDRHDRRVWGTKAFADFTDAPITIRVGAAGCGRIYNVNAQWDSLGEMAEKAGHGGGDFWELYYFARQVFTGEKAPWDIYSACDVTLAGIMALKSTESEKTEDIPDFRDPAVREKFRHDNFMQKHFDPAKIFPDGHDTAITRNFSDVMCRLCSTENSSGVPLVRGVFDGLKLTENFVGDSDRMNLIQDVRRLVKALPALAADYRTAIAIMEKYPDCVAGRSIQAEMEIAYPEKVLDTENTIAELKNWLENA